jgi:hypothetical protein
MRGGNIVTINGKNFVKTSKYIVKFGNFSAKNVVVKNTKTITCKAPAQQKTGKVNVSISANGKTSNAKPYTYVKQPMKPALQQRRLNLLSLSQIVNKLRLQR